MKNKLLHFALDLFSDSDDEEQGSIFAQVKIYRTTSVRIFEYVESCCLPFGSSPS